MNTQESHHVEPDPFFEYKETIQEILYRTLTKPDFTFQAKLFSIICFAYEMEEFFYPGTEIFTIEKMAAIVDKLYNHRFERIWLENFQGQKIDLELPMSMLQSLLLGAFKKADKDLQQLIKSAWTQYAYDDEDDTFLSVSYVDEKTVVKCQDMANGYIERRDRLMDCFSDEIDKYLENYCTHLVFAKNYVDASSLFQYVQMLLIRVMLLKFLLISQPGLMEVIEKAEKEKDKANREELIESLDSQVMDVFKTFSKDVSKSDEAIDVLRQSLQEQGMQEMGHMAVLVQF